MKKFAYFLILLLIFPTVSLAQDEITIDSLFDDSWVLRDDLPVFLDLADVEYTALLYQNEADIKVVFWAETDSEIHATLTFDPVYFLFHGDPVLIDPVTGDEVVIDFRFWNEMMIFEVSVTDTPQIIELYATSRMLRNRGELTTEDRIRQSRTIRWIRQQTESWSELQDDQIIAQPTMEPIICHGGYDPDSIKQAVIWANDITITGNFELIDCDFNRQHPAPQSVVYVGDIEYTGNHIWGGNTYIADFSDFKTEGMYRVRLRLNETVEVNDSNAFVIRDNNYFDLAAKAAGWYYYQRCGMEIPGWHDACHTEDIILRDNGEVVDVTGGWHDAGDYGKWIGPSTVSVWALATLHEEFADEQSDDSEFPSFIDEAAWGTEYICKGYWDGIFHPGFTPDMEDVCTWLGDCACEPPRILTEEEALVMSTKGPGISYYGATLARTGRMVMSGNSELAERCFDIAMDTYERDSAVDLSAPEYEERQTSYLNLQTGLLLLDIELYHLWGNEIYLIDADMRLANILEAQDDEGFFYRDIARTSMDVECNNHLLALYEYRNAYPGSEFDVDILDAFRRWADYTLRYANLSEFGLVGGETEDGEPWNLRYWHGNRRFGRFAWGLATAAIWLDDTKYLDAAEHQIQWIAGFNPTNISMMADVGHGPGCFHHRYCFIEGHQDGVVPGGILNGIMSGWGDEQILYLGDTDTKNFVFADVPFDYPVIDTDVWGWTYVYASNEYWARNSAWFVMGALQVERAVRECR